MGPCHRATVKAIIWCAVAFYGIVPGGVQRAVSIAWRESRFNPTAVSSTGCVGVYQYCDSTWQHLIDSWPVMNELYGVNRYSARGNVMRAIRSAHETGWEPWE